MISNPSSPKSKRISVNGISLSYLDWPGEGGPLICLPSLTGHKGSFTALARKLSPKFRLLAVDLRGRGDSSKPKEGYGFAYHARDILAFADSLELPTFSLIGHSFGATACVYIGSIRPDRVRSMVLLDGGADPKTETLRMMYHTINQLDKAYPSMEEYVQAQRTISYYKPWTNALEQYVREDVEVLADGSVRSKSSPGALERDLDVHFMYSMCLHFPNLQCPVLFLRPLLGLAGKNGHIFSDAEAANIVRHIPNCHRANIQGSNHYTMLIQDKPPVHPFIEEFLDRVLVKPALKRTV